MNFLLIDFGASRIKSIIYNTSTKKFSELYSTQGSFMSSSNVTSMNFFSKSFLEHLEYQKIKFAKIDAINICSEMHGFVMSEINRNLLEEKYVSWRSVNEKFTEKTLLDYFPNNDFMEKTGMKFRDGLPISNISLYNDCGKKYRYMGLCESLIEIHGKWFGKLSKSMASASGLYNINKNSWVRTSDNFPNIEFPEVVDNKTNIFGVIKINENEVPIYGCIGDLQASLLSIDLADNMINVNLGTGSQVSKNYKLGDENNFELRPTFGNNYFTTISHIPCGRVLDLFSKLFNQISDLNGGRKDIFWELFLSKSNTDEEKIFEVDLNLFKGSNNYKLGGYIKNINESNFNLETLVDSIKFSLISQYSEIIETMQVRSQSKFENILITGALAKKITDFSDLLSKKTGIKTEVIDHDYDAALVGLSKLSDYIYKRK
tara:strand:- start:1263 stop:2555 length:1293 start_codon:yes stop_codon:yes gene_type:complete